MNAPIELTPLSRYRTFLSSQKVSLCPFLVKPGPHAYTPINSWFDFACFIISYKQIRKFVLFCVWLLFFIKFIAVTLVRLLLFGSALQCPGDGPVSQAPSPDDRQDSEQLGWLPTCFYPVRPWERKWIETAPFPLGLCWGFSEALGPTLSSPHDEAGLLLLLLLLCSGRLLRATGWLLLGLTGSCKHTPFRLETNEFTQRINGCFRKGGALRKR